MSTVVEEFVATLGLKPDTASFKAATGLFGALVQGAIAAGQAIASIVQGAGKVAEGFVEGSLQKVQDLSKWADGQARGMVGRIVGIAKSALGEVTGLEGTLARISRETGMTVQEVHGVGYALTATGGSMEDLSTMAEHLGAQFNAAGMGSAHATIALGKFGITAKDSEGKAKGLKQILDDIANSSRFKNTKDGIGLTADIKAALGTSNAIPLLRKSQEERDRLVGEPMAFGATPTAEDMRGAQEYRKELSRLDLVVLGLKKSVAGPLQQALADSLKRFSDWVKALNGSGAQDVRSGFSQLSKLTWALTAGMQALYYVATKVAQYLDIIAVAAGAIIATQLTFWVFGLVASFVTGGAMAMLAWLPFLALFGLLFLVVDEVMTAMKGGKTLIGEYFPELEQALKDIRAMWINNGPAEALKLAFESLKQWLDDVFFGWFRKRWEELKQDINPKNWLGGPSSIIKAQIKHDNQNALESGKFDTAADFYSSPAYRMALAAKRSQEVGGAASGAYSSAPGAGVVANVAPGALAVSPSAGNRTAIDQRQIQAKFEIEIKDANDATKLGEEMRKVVGIVWDEKLGETQR